MLLVAAREVRDLPGRQRALDELVEPVAVSLLEGRSLRLPVVREHDDLVGARRVPARAVDPPELLVELAQRLERVRALEARVVRHLVVAGERRVDRRSTLEHVGQDAVHDQVADDDAHRGAHERVDAAAMTSRTNVAADRAQGRGPLEAELPEEEDEDARDVEAVREERAIAGVRPLLGLHPADGEDQVLGLAREEVPSARAAVCQQPDPGRVPPLDLRAVGGRRARHQRAGLLLHPPKGGDVLVRAQEDAGLARSGLRREVGLPFDEAMAIVREPAGHGGRVAVTHRPL